ncbi:hypothetical protein M1D96_13955 [Pseudomonas sp. D1-3]
MKAELWECLGKALIDNAELLEHLMLADSGIPVAGKPKKWLTWLLGQQLISEEDGILHLSGELLNLGIQLTKPGAERFAPDMEENYIQIREGCVGYLDAKRDGRMDAAAEQHIRVRHSARQIVVHLRRESLGLRSFIESGYGYSIRIADRIRDVESVIGRVQRLHEKLGLFSYDSLYTLTQGDRALNRVLINDLLGAVSINRAELLALLARLDTLTIQIRKQDTRLKKLHKVALYLQSGGSFDLEPLLDQPNAAAWVAASKQTIGGYLFTGNSPSEGLKAIEQLVSNLPKAKTKVATPTEAESRAAQPVTRAEGTSEEAVEPFAAHHFKAMLRDLVATNRPQSAKAYWLDQGQPGVETGIWLYALDGFFVALQAYAQNEEGRSLSYVLVPEEAPFDRISANRQVTDLWLKRSKIHA